MSSCVVLRRRLFGLSCCSTGNSIGEVTLDYMWGWIGLVCEGKRGGRSCVPSIAVVRSGNVARVGFEVELNHMRW